MGPTWSLNFWVLCWSNRTWGRLGPQWGRDWTISQLKCESVPPPCDMPHTARVAVLRNHCRVSLQSAPVVHFSTPFTINPSPSLPYISSCPPISFLLSTSSISLINLLLFFFFLPLLSKRYESQLRNLEQQSEQQRETLAQLQQEFQRAQAAKAGAPGKA